MSERVRAWLAVRVLLTECGPFPCPEERREELRKLGRESARLFTGMSRDERMSLRNYYTASLDELRRVVAEGMATASHHPEEFAR